MSLFLNLLFEQIANSNEYLLFNIYLLNLASIEPITSLVKLARSPRTDHYYYYRSPRSPRRGNGRTPPAPRGRWTSRRNPCVSSDRHPSLQHFGRSARSSSRSVIETTMVSLIEMSMRRSPKRSTACFFQRSVCIGRGMRWTRIKMGRFP